MEVEEEKDVLETLDEAFSDDDIEEESEAVEETAEETEEVTEEPEATPELDEAVTEETEVTTEEPDKWKTYGLERYDEMTREQIASDVAWRNRKYGEQANELGELRKKLEALEVPKPVEKPKEERPLTEGQIVDFNKQWEQDPAKAIREYGGLDAIVEERVAEILKNKVEPDMTAKLKEQADQMEFENFTRSNPDANIPAMQELDKFLGNPRPYGELNELAKLGLANDPIYNEVSLLMRKHATLSLTEAKKFATKSVKTVQTAKIKEAVRKTDAVNTKTKKAVAPKHEVMSMDDAFDVDD